MDRPKPEYTESTFLNGITGITPETSSYVFVINNPSELDALINYPKEIKIPTNFTYIPSILINEVVLDDNLEIKQIGLFPKNIDKLLLQDIHNTENSIASKLEMNTYINPTKTNKDLNTTLGIIGTDRLSLTSLKALEKVNALFNDNKLSVENSDEYAVAIDNFTIDMYHKDNDENIYSESGLKLIDADMRYFQPIGILGSFIFSKVKKTIEGIEGELPGTILDSSFNLEQQQILVGETLSNIGGSPKEDCFYINGETFNTYLELVTNANETSNGKGVLQQKLASSWEEFIGLGGTTLEENLNSKDILESLNLYNGSIPSLTVEEKELFKNLFEENNLVGKYENLNLQYNCNRKILINSLNASLDESSSNIKTQLASLLEIVTNQIIENTNNSKMGISSYFPIFTSGISPELYFKEKIDLIIGGISINKDNEFVYLNKEVIEQGELV